MESEKDNFETCSWLDALTKRHSVRSYNGQKLPRTRVKKIMDYVKRTMSNSNCFYETEETKKFRIEYHDFCLNDTMIEGDCECIAIIGPKNTSRLGLMKSGYLFQKIILYCTIIGVGTVWVGGRWLTEKLDEYLKSKKDYTLKSNEHVICLSPIGICSYGSIYKRPRYSYGRSRYENDKLFFGEEFGKALVIDKKFEKIFEAFKWSPSACNYQYWKIIKEGDEYHFVTSPSSQFYSNIDIGIGICNWEVGCRELNIKGNFYQKKDFNIRMPNSSIYFMSWKEEK